MGKPSKRPGRAARDIHATIRATADELRARPTFGVQPADELPELAELLESARAAVADTVPKCFDFHGRRYYLRVRLAFQYDIFDMPGAAVPLVRGASLSSESYGHAPGH